jgi:alpha-tubulin suppressor-like RCC1 family protein
MSRAIILDATVYSTNRTKSKKVSLVINRPAPTLTKLERLDQGNLTPGHRLIVKAYCQGCLVGELQYNWFVADALAGTGDNYLIKPEDLYKKIRVDAVSFSFTGMPYRTATMEFTPRNVTDVFSNAMIGLPADVSAALKNDGGLITWGSTIHGGGQTLSNVKTVANTIYAWAALKQDGTITTFGDPNTGGDSTEKNLVSVKSVTGNDLAFAAVKQDGTVVTWGDATRGGAGEIIRSISSIAKVTLTNVKEVVASQVAFVGLKNDGTLVYWGLWQNRIEPASNLSNVKVVFASPSAFAAVKNDNSVVTFGDASRGGNSSGKTLTNIKTIYSNRGAFAALKNDGTVVTWGHANFGGDSTDKDLTGIVSIASSSNSSSGSFAALKSDGRVITWPGSPSNLDLTNIKQVISYMQSQFLALKHDGSVVIWGESYPNGATLYASGVADLVSLSGGGAIIKKSDGSWVIEPYQNESSTPANALFEVVTTNTHP